MSRLGMPLVIGAGLLVAGLLAGCSLPSLHQGRLGNLEYALVEVRDRQDRMAEEFRERLDSLELSLLQQERFLQEALNAEDATMPMAGRTPRQPPGSAVAVTPDPKPAPPKPGQAVPEPRTPSEPASTPGPRRTPQPEVRPAPPPPPAAPPVVREHGEAKALYDQALAKYFRGEFVQARADFFAFQERFPDHPLAPNALYWQAETHYAQKQFAQSILVFKELSRRFPKSTKAPDALLKAGFAYEQLGDYPNARFHLQIVIDDHPDTPAYRLARERLPQLPPAAS